MLISVVIPTFQRPALLHRCLEALYLQRYDSDQFEILVVSDGPDPSTEKITKDWKIIRQLNFLSLHEKKGPAAARNLGWRSSSGQLILFTDDDCLPDQDWILSYAQVYERQEYYAFTGRLIVPVSAKPTDFEINTRGLETAEFITANCACTRPALLATGGFDEQFSMAWREDSDLQFKLLQKNIPIKNVPQAIVVHPVRAAPWGISMKEQKKGIYNALLYKKHPQLYRQKIGQGIVWNYVVMVVSFIAGLVCVAAATYGFALLFFMIWFCLICIFIFRRLGGKSRSASHISEMIATSLVIPFLSLYWHFYGALKYRILFF